MSHFLNVKEWRQGRAAMMIWTMDGLHTCVEPLREAMIYLIYLFLG